MPRPALAVLAVLALAAPPSGARAEAPGRCRDLFVESRFDLARACFEEALDEAQGDLDAVAALFAYRAATYAALREDDQARESMEVVLALQPRWEPSDPLLTSPKITELLASVRASFQASAGRPSLEHEAAPSLEVEGEELVVRARAPNVDAPLQVVLMVRREGAARFQAVPLGGEPGRHLSAEVVLEPGETVAYYVAVTTPGGWAALRSGSPDEPFLARRTAGGPGPGPGPGSGPGGEPPGLGRRLWWVWTLVGVAVVGTAVGLGVGLGLSADEATGSVRLRFP